MTTRKIFAIATFVYFFLAPFTYHPDIKTIFYQVQFLLGGVFNIYSFFEANRNLAVLGPFVYPPLAYFIYGILFIPVKLIAGRGFVEWLGMGNDAVSVTHIFRYLFAIKLPAIFVHFATALVLTQFFQDENSKKKALLLWFFNPIGIYVVTFMGQIDGVAVFLTALALLYVGKRPTTSLILLGIGGAFKTYPLLLIPFLSFIIGKDWLIRFKYLILGLLPYTLVILPFLATPSFYNSTLVSGLTQRIFELELPLGYGESLAIIPGILVFLFIATVSKRLVGEKNLLFFFLVVTLSVVVGTHFHPQWTLWPLPFLVITTVKGNKLKQEDFILAVILFFVGWLGTILLFDDKFLTWGILSPLDEGVLFLPPPADVLKRFTNPGLLQSLFHTIMVASGIWVLLKISPWRKPLHFRRGIDR